MNFKPYNLQILVFFINFATYKIIYIMRKYLQIILFGLLMVSCGTPKDIAYFQDRQPGTSAPAIIRNSTPFKVRPGDRVSIFVKSRNEKLSQQFNMYSGNSMSNMGLGNGQSGYLVDEKGEIDFPVLGKLKLEGLDRKEITDTITNILRNSRLVDDAIVKVEYTGLYVTILGEGGGKRINIDKDRLTFFELLAQIGDLDINALRKNILVIREEDGVRSQFEIDLTKGETWCVIQIQRAIRRRLPTAVIASGSRLTRYVLKAIRNAGIRSPEDLSIIGYGDSMWTDMMEPPLTTFQRNSGDLALAAVEMLMEQIEHGKTGGERRYVPVSLTKRKSVKMLENGPFGEKAVSVEAEDPEREISCCDRVPLYRDRMG